MPLPTERQVHQNAALSQVAINYGNALYIWPECLPIVPVEKQSDKYYLFDRADIFRNEAKKRPVGGAAPRGGYRLSTDSYACEPYSFAEELPDEVRENADSALQPEINATRRAMDKVLLAMEIEIASAIFVNGVWGTSVSGASSGGDFVYWDTYASSTPISDIQTGRRTILLNSGVKPNALVLGFQVYEALKEHPDITAKVQYSTLTGQPAMVTKELLAQIFEVDKVLVGEAVYNTASEGQSASMSHIWGKHALLCYVAPTPSRDTPSAGYTFRWKEKDVVVQNWREDANHQDVYEAESYLDFKITSTVCGYFFNGAIA